MEKIKKILKESASLPLFLQNMEVSKKQELPVSKREKGHFSHKVLVTLALVFFFSETCAFNGKFLAYCGHVNLAEWRILEGKPREALSCYDSAFALSPSPLAKDIHNALVCAKKLKDKTKIEEYLDLMVAAKSMKPEYYRSHGLFPYLSRKERKEVKRKHAARLESDAYQFVRELVKKDQQAHSGRLFVSGVDLATFKEYRNYFADFLPDEALLIDIPRQRIDHILFFHWFQIKADVAGMVEKAVENLQYHNVDYAYHSETMQGSLFFKSKYGLVVEKKVKRKITPFLRSEAEIEKINKNRASIGLDSYEEYVEKVAFFKKHKEYRYMTGYYQVRFNHD